MKAAAQCPIALESSMLRHNFIHRDTLVLFIKSDSMLSIELRVRYSLFVLELPENLHVGRISDVQLCNLFVLGNDVHPVRRDEPNVVGNDLGLEVPCLAHWPSPA